MTSATVRDVVRFLDPVGKQRPAVVLRIEQDRALLLAGTTKGPRQIPHIYVDPATRLTASMRLPEPTYFNVDALHLVALSSLTVTGGRCPPGVFAKFRLLTEAAERRFLRAYLAQAPLVQAASSPEAISSPHDASEDDAPPVRDPVIP